MDLPRCIADPTLCDDYGTKESIRITEHENSSIRLLIIVSVELAIGLKIINSRSFETIGVDV